MREAKSLIGRFDRPERAAEWIEDRLREVPALASVLDASVGPDAIPGHVLAHVSWIGPIAWDGAPRELTGDAAERYLAGLRDEREPTGVLGRFRGPVARRPDSDDPLLGPR